MFFTTPGRARVDTTLTVSVEMRQFPNEHRTVTLIPGDIVYLLTYHGEGEYTAWFNDQLLTVSTVGFKNGGSNCRDCEGEILERGHREWWVTIRNSKGETGWTDRTEDFDGKDRYGR